MALGTDPTFLLLHGAPVLCEIADDLARDGVRAITRLHEAGGALDAVVLVGDLTRSATAEEFASVSRLVDRILDECCEAPGLTELPLVLAVPGPRDRTPMAAGLATVRSVTEWWPQVRDGFWNDETPDVRETIRSSFAPFEDWYAGYRVDPGWRAGLLPGDGGVVLHAGGPRLGLATLNSAFRMLTADAEDGCATLHSRQLEAVTTGPDWRPAVHALAIFAPLSADLRPDVAAPVFPIAGRPGAPGAGQWITADARARLFVARGGAEGRVQLSDTGSRSIAGC